MIIIQDENAIQFVLKMSFFLFYLYLFSLSFLLLTFICLRALYYRLYLLYWIFQYICFYSFSVDEMDNCFICLIPMHRIFQCQSLQACHIKMHCVCFIQYLQYHWECPVCHLSLTHRPNEKVNV